MGKQNDFKEKSSCIYKYEVCKVFIDGKGKKGNSQRCCKSAIIQGYWPCACLMHIFSSFVCGTLNRKLIK